MDIQQSSSRRDFLKTAGAAGAALAIPYVITSSALGDDKRPPASDRIVVGGIGIGNMGNGDQNAFLGRGDVQYVASALATWAMATKTPSWDGAMSST
ncbi:MAG: twin-arginine translocation signal domain-containing protein [Planctomycetes bacterium]|nr:twin-arginine translocation signal domain-containing protein [Planctomycetota bacterium]